MKIALVLAFSWCLTATETLAEPTVLDTVKSDDILQIMERASRGDAGAQYELAQMYDDGFDLPQNRLEALKWYKKSAVQGNVNAQYRLGGIYYWGQGVETDYQEAHKWFKKAAEQGDAYAQFNLGVMCRKGRGTATNYVEAYKWFSLAANHNDEDAQQKVLSLEKEMSPEQLKQARQAVEAWYQAHP